MTLTFEPECSEGEPLLLSLPAFRLSATTLLEHAFCPRFVFFENHLGIPEHQEKRLKVQKGRAVHEERSRVNRQYLRKRVGCIERHMHMRLYDRSGLFSGVTDEVLFCEDGTVAPLDYKWAKWDGYVHETYLIQLAYYGLLAGQVLGRPVRSGYLVYVRSKHKLVCVALTREVYGQLAQAIWAVYRIQEEGYFPEGRGSSKKCSDCCYRRICPRF